MGAGLEDWKKELGFEVETSNFDWTIHPGGAFSFQCDLCTSTTRGCRTGQGVFLFILYLSLFFNIVHILCRPDDVWHSLVES